MTRPPARAITPWFLGAAGGVVAGGLAGTLPAAAWLLGGWLVAGLVVECRRAARRVDDALAELEDHRRG